MVHWINTSLWTQKVWAQFQGRSSPTLLSKARHRYDVSVLPSRLAVEIDSVENNEDLIFFLSGKKRERQIPNVLLHPPLYLTTQHQDDIQLVQFTHPSGNCFRSSVPLQFTLIMVICWQCQERLVEIAQFDWFSNRLGPGYFAFTVK